jgi:hypothetical protein
MKTSLVFLITLLSFSLFSQSIHFKVIEIEKMKPLPGVKITSSLVPKEVFKTDGKGQAFINHLIGDTIVFNKEFYYPVSICIKQKDYDFNHVAEVIMVPSTKRHVPSYLELQSFEYHFVHDTLGEDSRLDITTLEPKDAMLTREVWKGKSFRFSHIDITGKSEKSVDKYNLQK